MSRHESPEVKTQVKKSRHESPEVKTQVKKSRHTCHRSRDKSQNYRHEPQNTNPSLIKSKYQTQMSRPRNINICTLKNVKTYTTFFYIKIFSSYLRYYGNLIDLNNEFAFMKYIVNFNYVFTDVPLPLRYLYIIRSDI